MIEFILLLILAHLLTDFVFQPSSWVRDKVENKIRSVSLYKHIGVYSLALISTLRFDFSYWREIIILIFSHYLIDLVKSYSENGQNKRKLFVLDQLLHFVIILLVASWSIDISLSLDKIFSKEALLIVVAIVLLTFASSVIIQVFMSRWTVSDGDDSLKDAGKYIGYIERIFIFIFILLNQWSAIGFLLTAKSVFRFGDLSRAKDRKLTEYILIGTLMSFGIAIVVGVLYNYIKAIL